MDIIKLCRPGDIYHIRAEVGGGGGHSLTIKKVQVKISLLDMLPPVTDTKEQIEPTKVDVLSLEDN